MAQAKLIESLDEFLDVLGQSKLLPPELTEKLRKDLAGSDKQPVDVARLLLKSRKLTKWQAGQLVSGYHKFRQGQFVLRDQLGKSRLGGLFLAHDEQRNQLVTLRSLSKAALAQTDAVRQVVATAKAATKFEHENVARILEVNSEAGKHLIVSEYVHGCDLQKLVEENGPRTPAQALGYLSQAADALEKAHQQQIIHGSLHPACLLIDSDGVVKISDWGLAPLRDRGSVYRAPEQTDGQPEASSDVFSLGGTLYYLLAGQAPLASSSGAENDSVSTQYGTLPQNLPSSVVELCGAMMATDPAARLASMHDVVSRITEIGEIADEAPVGEQEDVSEEVDLSDALVEESALEASTEDEASAETDVLAKPDASESVKQDGTGTDNEGTSDGSVTHVGPSAVTPSRPEPAAIAISSGKEAKAAAPVSAFKISTKKKRKKSRGKSKEKNAAVSEDSNLSAKGTDSGDATAQQSAKGSAPRTKKSGLPIGLIIGLAALFGLTLLGGGGLLVVLMLSRGGGDAVASASNGESSATPDDPESTAAAVDPEDVPYEIELVDDAPAEAGADATSEKAGDPAVTTAAIPGAAVPNSPIGSPAGSAVPGVAPAEPPASSPPATPPVVGTPRVNTPSVPTGVSQPAPTAEQPTAPPVEDAAKKKAAADAKKKADDAAAAKVKADEAAAAKNKADAKQKADAKKKADEQKKAPAGPVFVFSPAIELPPLPAAGAPPSPKTPLGRVNIAATDDCFISMMGGETAARGSVEFALRNAKGSTAPRDWEFVVKEDSVETVVATMSLPATELAFQWLPAAAASEYAGNLRNCQLKLTAGKGKPQVLEVSLRSPVSGESVPIDLGKATVQARWNLESPPDPGKLQLVTSMKGPKFTLEPEPPVNAMKGTQWIYLGETKKDSMLALKLESTVNARGVQVTIKPFLTIPGQKPLAYNKGTKKKVAQELAMRTRYEAEVIVRQEQLKNAPDPQKKQVQVLLTQAQQQLQAFDKMANQLDQLDQIEQTYNGANLDFEVIYRTLKGQTVLVKTKAGGAP